MYSWGTASRDKMCTSPDLHPLTHRSLCLHKEPCKPQEPPAFQRGLEGERVLEVDVPQTICCLPHPNEGTTRRGEQHPVS